MLTVTDLTKTIADRTLIDNLSFTVRHGERCCLFAPSGAGKSTLIHILSGLDQQFSGHMSVNARCRTTVFQEPGLFWYKTVKENILYPLKLNRIAVNSIILQQYEKWMALTELKPFESCYPHQISGGMKQKSAIIRAFMARPDLILMDEPLKSMDMPAKRKIAAHIRAFYPDVTVLLVTHDPHEIPLIADTVLVFKETRLSNVCESLEISIETSPQELADRLWNNV